MNRLRVAYGGLLVASSVFAACGHRPPPAETPTQPDTPPPAASQAWQEAERPLLSDWVQLTFRDKFIKAGEQYFSPDGSWVIFQAIAVPDSPAAAPGMFYSMYVAKVRRDSTGGILGLDEPFMISPPMSANTCGWFHPTQPGRVMYGSTMGEPSGQERSGFQVGTNRYRWAFPSEMEIATQTVRPITMTLSPREQAQCGTDYLASTLFTREGYDAECSWDKSGRFVLYANVDQSKTTPDGRADADIYIYDTQTHQHHPIVVAPGYDGGPFFSPDGKRICYRSDRKNDDLLQIYVADLKFETDASGTPVPVGMEREYALTSNSAVNWAPFWHPSGRYLVYGTSEVGHSNYEVFAVEFDREKLLAGRGDELRRRRVTHAPGADVLPTFSADGTVLMWTSQRGAAAPGEEKPSSQIWVARWNGDPFGKEWRE
ncbi:MAG: hypothetical protein AMXMBFR58_18060 [Phycisphaerae bacterium]|nr:Protein TolB [Phycisphaerales bacterium]